MDKKSSNLPTEIKFTGEYFVPGRSGDRIEADHMARYKFAAKYVRGKSVLDIACGTGYAAPILIDAGATSYHGGDIQQLLIDHAKNNYNGDNINFDIQDLTKLNKINQYEVITCFETIEHIQEYQLCLDNLYKALRPNGILLVSSPNRIITSPGATKLSDKPNNEYHTQEFIPTELIEKLHLAGFAVDPDQIYGQRQRLDVNNRYIRKIIRFLKPDEHASPEISRVTWKTPRYFIIRARKPDSA